MPGIESGKEPGKLSLSSERSNADSLDGGNGIRLPAVSPLQKAPPPPPVVQKMPDEEFDERLRNMQVALAAVTDLKGLKKLFDGVAGNIPFADNETFTELSNCSVTTFFILRTMLGDVSGLAAEKEYSKSGETTKTWKKSFDKTSIGTFRGEFTSITRGVALFKLIGGDHVFTLIKQGDKIFLNQGWEDEFSVVKKLNKGENPVDYNKEFTTASLSQFLTMMTNGTSDEKNEFTQKNTFSKDLGDAVWGYLVKDASAAESKPKDGGDSKESASGALPVAKKELGEALKKTEKSKEKTKAKSKCFITAACAEGMGLPDNCEPLEVLRTFRDNVLVKMPGGASYIKRYYDLTQDIATGIARRPDEMEIYARLYRIIETCVDAIKKEQYKKAFRIYKTILAQLHQTYAVNQAGRT